MTPHSTPVVRQRWHGHDLLSYPGRPPTLVHILDHAVRHHADRQGLVDADDTCTYHDVGRRVAGAVDALRDRGVTRGDAVGVAADNGVDLAVLLFACATAGAVMVGLPPRSAPPRWARLLDVVGARHVLSDHGHAPAVRAAVGHAAAPIAVGALADVARATPTPWRWQAPAEDATFAVVGTAGTTGAPKASRVVHRCSVHSALSYRDVVGLHGDDRTAVLFPLTYISALHAHVLPMMLVGGTSVLTADARPRAFARLLADQRITWMYTVPSLWLALLRTEGFSADTLPDLRAAAFGGAPFPPDALAEVRRRLPGVRLHNIYGLSETHSPATMLQDHEFADRPDSVGRPLPCMEARVVDADGRTVPPDTPGELHLRGSLVTTGYVGDEAATAAAFDGGWLRTGDHARMDAAGYVWILGRRRDQILRGGFTIAPVEVEQALRRAPGVVDAAVYGVPDRVGGEAVACAVVADDGVSVAAVRAWVRDHIADYAVPRHVRFVDALPLTPLGKLDRDALRRRTVDDTARSSR